LTTSDGRDYKRATIANVIITLGMLNDPGNRSGSRCPLTSAGSSIRASRHGVARRASSGCGRVRSSLACDPRLHLSFAAPAREVVTMQSAQ
jgi:hypothetical protein